MNQTHSIIKRTVRVLSATVLALGVAGGCGDADDETADEQTAQSSSPYTLDNVCAVLAHEICAARTLCCETGGIGFDAEGCEALQAATCEANVAATRGGTMSFDPTHIDACLDALAERLQGCTANKADMPGRVPELKLCHSIFMGQHQPGEPCTTDEQCREPTAANQVAFCDHAGSKTCFIFEAAAEGEACEAGPGARTMCVAGLYCETDFTGAPPFPGVCRPATELGAPCDASAQPISLECGAGFYCDANSQTCQAAQPGGHACSNGAACVSTVCTESSCTDPELMVNREKCHGS